MPVIRKLTRVGDSFMICIPPEILRELDAKRGDYLVWHININNEVIIEKLTPKQHPGFFIPGTGLFRNGK